MVDFSFDNSSFSADGFCLSSATPTLRSLYLRTDSAYGRPLDWPLDGVSTKPTGTLTARIPNIQLFKGDAVGLSTVSSNGFINGVWSGVVVVTNAANNIVLRAVDKAGHFGESAPFTATPLKLEAGKTNNTLVLRFATVAGKQYVVETNNSPTGAWAARSPVITGDGAVQQFTDTPAASPRFYRLNLLP
jgi:hypothetical protein